MIYDPRRGSMPGDEDDAYQEALACIDFLKDAEKEGEEISIDLLEEILGDDLAE